MSHLHRNEPVSLLFFILVVCLVPAQIINTNVHRDLEIIFMCLLVISSHCNGPAYVYVNIVVCIVYMWICSCVLKVSVLCGVHMETRA